MHIPRLKSIIVQTTRALELLQNMQIAVWLLMGEAAGDTIQMKEADLEDGSDQIEGLNVL
jgi:hypothetical protein